MSTTPPATTASPRHRSSSLSVALALPVIPRFGSLSLSPSSQTQTGSAASGISVGAGGGAAAAAGHAAEEYKKAFSHARSASAGGAAPPLVSAGGGAMAIPSYASRHHDEVESLCEADEHPEHAAEATTSLALITGSVTGGESQSSPVTAAATTLFSNGARWGWPSPPASSSSSSPPRSIANGLKPADDNIIGLPPSPPTSEFGSLPLPQSHSSMSTSVGGSSVGHHRQNSLSLGALSFATSPSNTGTKFGSTASSSKAMSASGGPSKVTAGMVPLSRVRSAGASMSSSTTVGKEGFGIFRRLSVGGFGTRPKAPTSPSSEAPPVPTHRSTTQPVASVSSPSIASPATADRERTRRASTNTTRPKRRISPMGERMLRGGFGGE